MFTLLFLLQAGKTQLVTDFINNSSISRNKTQNVNNTVGKNREKSNRLLNEKDDQCSAVREQFGSFCTKMQPDCDLDLSPEENQRGKNNNLNFDPVDSKDCAIVTDGSNEGMNEDSFNVKVRYNDSDIRLGCKQSQLSSIVKVPGKLEHENKKLMHNRVDTGTSNCNSYIRKNQNDPRSEVTSACRRTDCGNEQVEDKNEKAGMCKPDNTDVRSTKRNWSVRSKDRVYNVEDAVDSFLDEFTSGHVEPKKSPRKRARYRPGQNTSLPFVYCSTEYQHRL